MAFREISVEQLKDNPFTLINKDWMLITAGDGEKHNTMTASWGDRKSTRLNSSHFTQSRMPSSA